MIRLINFILEFHFMTSNCFGSPICVLLSFTKKIPMLDSKQGIVDDCNYFIMIIVMSAHLPLLNKLPTSLSYVLGHYNSHCREIETILSCYRWRGYHWARRHGWCWLFSVSFPFYLIPHRSLTGGRWNLANSILNAFAPTQVNFLSKEAITHFLD